VGNQGEADLRAANGQFYAALRAVIAGDGSAMDGIWAHEPGVTTMHPLGGRQVGWDAVRASWQQVSGIGVRTNMDAHDLTATVVGETGIVTGTESDHLDLFGRTLDYSARVTNVFRNEGGRWVAIAHHVDVAPDLIALVTPPEGTAAAR
jgi:hypothetical protein